MGAVGECRRFPAAKRTRMMLPIFMFVFLVALGIDYGIFLFGRIKEEVVKHGVREGVHVAVARTEAIITSAGIILTGTFAGMMAGEMMLLKQLGFAVAVGVLIDTFVVRTILDPALVAFFGRWTWWPGGVPGAREPQPIKPVPVPEAGDYGCCCERNGNRGSCKRGGRTLVSADLGMRENSPTRAQQRQCSLCVSAQLCYTIIGIDPATFRRYRNGRRSSA